MNVSIIIPAYNEEKRIGATLEQYSKYCKERYLKDNLEYEILVVINNTKDNTEGVVLAAQKKDKKIRFLNLKKGGKGYAVLEGFKDSLKRNNQIIGFVDADLATKPSEFYKLIDNLKGYDFVIASRGLKNSDVNSSLVRKITNRGFNFVVRSILFLPFKDTQCGAKIFTRKSIDSVYNDLSDAEWGFDVDLLLNLVQNGFKGKEIATVWEDKRGSKINLISVPIHMFAAVVRLRLIHSPFKDLVRIYDKLPKFLKI